MKAVLPAGGRGVRMASTTGGFPKELLQVAGREVLLWGIEEAAETGLSGVTVITSPSKPEIEGFLGQADLALPVQIETQDEPMGLAHAVSLAGCEDDALVILPDTLFFPDSPSGRVVQAIHKGADMAFAVETVSDADVSQYGILRLGHSGAVLGIVEKPSAEAAPSRLAIAGRVGLSRRMMEFFEDYVAEQPAGVAEQGWTPVFNAAIAGGMSAIAIPLESGEQRFDCGSPEGYLEAKRVIEGSLTSR